MFYSKKWKIEYLPDIKGQYKDVKIIFRNIPCKINSVSGKKKCPYNDFSSELYEVLISQLLEDFSQVKRRVEVDNVLKGMITLREYRRIEVLLILDKTVEGNEFYHNVGEAIIDAFSKAEITL
jgi:hypothetical protein